MDYYNTLGLLLLMIQSVQLYTEYKFQYIDYNMH